MKNPFRSEADAFRFVWLTVGYCALIVIGSVINVWLGVAVFVVLTVGALWWLLARKSGTDSDGIAAVAFGVAKPATPAVATDDMVFSAYAQGSGWFERMRLTNGGNLGIGTPAPTARLAVRGDGTDVLVGSAGCSAPTAGCRC